MTATAPDASRRPGAGRWRRAVRAGWWSREHGAWALLLMPFAAGVLRSGFEPLHVPLLAACLVGYLTLNATSTWILDHRTHRRASRREAPAGRPPRGRAPTLVYGAATVVLLVFVLARRPDLAPWGLLYGPVAVCLVGCAGAGRAHALLPRLVAVVGAGASALVAYQAGNPPSGTITVGVRAMAFIAGVVVLYLVGATLFVRTVLRARGSRVHLVVSVAFHVACAAGLAAAALWAPHPPGLPRRGLLAFAVVFALLSARAALFGGRRIAPGLVGAGETLACLAILAVVARWP